MISPTIWDRLVLPVRNLFMTMAVALASWEDYRGFRIAAIPPRGLEAADCLRGLRRAIDVLGLVYPQKLRRLRKDVPRIFAVGTGKDRRVVGGYIPSRKMCIIDPSYLLRTGVTPEHVAGTIVHEAMHARLHGLGISQGWDMPERVEGICERAEEGFWRALRGEVNG